MFSWRANDTSKRLYWYFGNSSRSFKEHANSNKWCLSDNFVVLHCTVLINKLFITILQCQETKWLPSNYLVSTHSGTWDYSFHLNCSLQLVRMNSESSSSSNSRSSLKYSVAAFLFHIDLKKFTERHFETNWSNFTRALVCIRQAHRPLWRHNYRRQVALNWNVLSRQNSRRHSLQRKDASKYSEKMVTYPDLCICYKNVWWD